MLNLMVNRRVVGMLIRAFAESLAQAPSVLSPFLVGLMVSSLGHEVWALAQGANLMLHLDLDRRLEGHEVDCLVVLLESKAYAVVPVSAAKTQTALSRAEGYIDLLSAQQQHFEPVG